jgi:hypothetical protein
LQNEITVAIVAGLLGGVISPIIYSEYQAWRREHKWAKPRKTRLKSMLRNKTASPSGWRSLDRLCLETGMKEDECRSLLIEINARGGMIKIDGTSTEAWTLNVNDEHKV